MPFYALYINSWLFSQDPYIGRSLPYIIGTQAFYQDDDVGLVDEPSGILIVREESFVSYDFYYL